METKFNLEKYLRENGKEIVVVNLTLHYFSLLESQIDKIVSSKSQIFHPLIVY